ncbi:toprim domain-containing protein [Pedobacter sp. HMF7056]|uniref:Toprim domain-containing protein n=2 Tax=Hufsiella ginkgonis TaxID=2695274 RepID=A0A7K1XSQ5_9SPHI|nr:toprim domain-containing protein [Hufsiella ginkgonis]MXV13916.1 toprim domain-containing protein [Hufsiella ginkgonis]
MDVIELVQRLEKLTKHEALEKCKTLIGGDSAVQVHPAAELTRTAVLTRQFTYFKNAVHNSKPAQDYIAGRGLDFRKTEIGYNAGQFHHGTRKEEHLVQSCLKYGLLIDKNLTNSRTGEKAYQPFGKCCLVFALRNNQHQISGLYFRSTVNNDHAKHFYLKERSGLYPGYPDPATKKLILTESVIDAATLLQLDPVTATYSVLAAYGTNGLNEEHRAAIKALADLQELIFAFDSDDAGQAAARKYAAELHGELPALKISTLALPCKDVNETALAHQDQALFSQLLAERTDLFLSTENLSAEKEKPAPFQPVPEPPKEAPALNVENPWKLSFRTDTARYYILGGISKLPDSLKVTLAIETESGKSRVKLDLYEDKQVEKTAREAAEKLHIDTYQMETDLHKLTDLLESYREQELLKNRETDPGEEVLTPLTALEREQAEALAKSPSLITELSELLGKTGIVGEENSRLLLFLIAASYKMAEPLHALIQGSSGSGKTRLLRQISDCMPPEKVTRLTRVSDKALYNYPKNFLINRLLCLEDMDGLPEEAGLAFRELQSNGELILFESIVLKVDELDGSLRAFFERLKGYLEKTYPGNHQKAEFSLLEVRQALALSKTQLFRYVNELTALEYLRQSGGYANRGFKYRIVYWDNYLAIREKIRAHLENQLDALKAGTPRNTRTDKKRIMEHVKAVFVASVPSSRNMCKGAFTNRHTPITYDAADH